MKRQCDVCGITYEAKRATSKYHSDVCRKRAQRLGMTRSTRPVSESAVTTSPTTAAQQLGLVVPAVLEELRRAGVEDSAAGRVALALALRLDVPGADTGSAVASVAKQLLEAVERAVKTAKGEGDPMDEFSARLRAKLGGA